MEITDHDKGGENQRVYFSGAKWSFSMEWKDENILSIVNDDPQFLSENRNIEWEIGKEIYHEDGSACDSWVMKDEYETCYQN
ncbi:hypothetical protein [Bacillus sp. AK128]